MSSGPDEHVVRHRGRRASRPAGPVGDVDEARLRSSLPAVRRPDPGTAVRDPAEGAGGAGAGGGAMPTRDDDELSSRPASAASRPGRRAPDDEDVGWGARVEDSNDERLTRERPPHW